jgi:hypothetical protein
MNQPSRHDMFALAETLEIESRFYNEVARLRQTHGGYRDAEQVEQASQVHGDDGEQSGEGA